MGNLQMDKYKEAFLKEAREHVETVNGALVKLEKAPTDTNLLYQISWAMHTLKSIAAAMGYQNISSLCHAVEDILERIKQKKISLEKCSDILFKCFDFLDSCLKLISKEGSELDSKELVERLKVLGVEGLAESPAPTAPSLEAEMKMETPEKIQAIEVKVERLDRLLNLSEELLVTKMRFDRIRENLENPEFSAATEMLGRIVSELQYQVMQSRMVPIGFVFNRFPRMIRDVAKAEKKEVELILEGSEIELDRVVIDEIGESLVHLLRNAVDHGLETPDLRERTGKPLVGTIRLTASRSKEAVSIEVSDDGQGLDLEEIKIMAMKRGILNPEATQEETMNSIFNGVSTTKEVSTVSGRGLGMTIVRKKIESIGGSVRVKSTTKQGTTFALEIPLTLAVINTLFVQVQGKIYAIPVSDVDRLVAADSGDIKGMLNYEAIVLDKEDIPMTRLSAIFGLDAPLLPRQPIVVVRKDDERLGLAVDSLLSTQEVVVKPLHRLLRESRFFSGTAIIGSGEAILILDVAHLILSKKGKTLNSG
ncbi:MAG: chemotaxis protein CheA [Elusimicrobia bacterium]|nr:chemotaxis protein CheA [Elusimicrobiota bacterium]